MSNDEAVEAELRELNQQIPLKEFEADKSFFRNLLHDSFVFHRASGDLDDKKWFIEKLEKGEARDTQVQDVQVFGHRAIVTASVFMTAKGQRTEYHNLRMFLREESGSWKLFAWANERVGPVTEG